MDHTDIFKKLWLEYSNTNPSAKRIEKILIEHGETIVNDHVAFRTYDLPGINIDALSEIFLDAGYVEKGEYMFEKKRLQARHYEHPVDLLAPKVFISELITSEFSELVNETAAEMAKATLENISSAADLIFSLNSLPKVSYKRYLKLLEESEYAAWMYVWGFRANHFTIFINHLKNFASIESLNEFLKEQGYTLNSSGGEIKGTTEQLLKQSSTMADLVKVEFEEGIFEVPCCYYEFAQRFDKEPGKLYNGFIASSADKIFESTNSR